MTTPRNPYMQAYYQEHREEIIKKVKKIYRNYDRKPYRTHDIGTEYLAPGIQRVWYKGNPIGEIEWTYNHKYQCAAGDFRTVREALEALKELEESK